MGRSSLPRWCVGGFAATCVALATIVSSSSVQAQATKPATVRTAFEKVCATYAAKTKGHRKAFGLGAPVRHPVEQPDSEYGRLLVAYRDAQRDFMRTFRAADWRAFSNSKDGELLRVGLSEVVEDALRDGDVSEGVRAAEALIRRVPEARTARYAFCWRLPVLTAETRGVAAALRRADKLRSALIDDIERRVLDTWRGNALAALGRDDEARQSWNAAAKRDEKTAALRARLLGKPVPELPKGKDVGGKIALSKGRVAVLLFLGSSDHVGLARAVRLESLRREIGPEKLDVIGIVEPVNGTLLPRSREQALARTVLKRSGKAPETDLVQVRQSLGLSFPLRVNHGGKWAGTDQHLVNAVVIDREGRVRAFGGREAHLAFVREAVKRLTE